MFFYAQPGPALLLNGRKTNLDYGSYAPGAPDVFPDDTKFVQLWRQPVRYYLLAEKPEGPRFERLVGKDALILVKASGGKFLWTNHAYAVEAQLPNSPNPIFGHLRKGLSARLY